MKTSITITTALCIVVATALGGMVLGGLFGWAAGHIAPDFFRHSMMWAKVEPVGMAVVLGAFGGVICGGALGAFAILAHLASQWLARPADADRRG